MTKTETIRHALVGKTFTRADGATVAPLAEIIDTAQRQLGWQDIAPGGDWDRVTRRSKVAGANGTLSLRSLLPEITGTPSRPSMAATSRLSGEQMTIGQAVLMNSRVAMAGSHIVTLPEQRLIDGTAPALTEAPSGLRLIHPAPFAEVVETLGEGEIPASTLASIITEGSVDRLTMKQIGVRIPLPRSAMKDVGEAQLTAEVLASIALGVGSAIDRLLLSALVAATPAAFTPAAAATKGIRWQELMALVGTSGAGAAADRGDLFVAGVPAEITPDMAATIVAAYDRFAVIVSPEIDLLVTRMDAAGSVTLTGWFDAQAIIPDAGFAWVVA